MVRQQSYFLGLGTSWPNSWWRTVGKCLFTLLLNLPGTKTIEDFSHPKCDLGNILVPESKPLCPQCLDCNSPFLLASVSAPEGPWWSPSPWHEAARGTGWHPATTQHGAAHPLWEIQRNLPPIQPKLLQLLSWAYECNTPPKTQQTLHRATVAEHINSTSVLETLLWWL